jgi:hypothetical protein
MILYVVCVCSHTCMCTCVCVYRKHLNGHTPKIYTTLTLRLFSGPQDFEDLILPLLNLTAQGKDPAGPKEELHVNS